MRQTYEQSKTLFLSRLFRSLRSVCFTAIDFFLSCCVTPRTTEKLYWRKEFSGRKKERFSLWRQFNAVPIFWSVFASFPRAIFCEREKVLFVLSGCAEMFLAIGTLTALVYCVNVHSLGNQFTYYTRRNDLSASQRKICSGLPVPLFFP